MDENAQKAQDDLDKEVNSCDYLESLFSFGTGSGSQGPPEYLLDEQEVPKPSLERQGAQGITLVADDGDTVMAETTTASSPTPKQFRLNGKNIFLTYPQCACPLEVAFKRLERKFQTWGIKYMVVGQEEHGETGGLHLHAVVMLEKRLNISSPRRLDLQVNLESWHGDYRVARKVGSCIEYCKKEGKFKELGQSPIVKERVKKKDTQSLAVWEDMKAGTGLRPLVEKYGPYMVLHFRAVKEFHQYWNGSKEALVAYKGVEVPVGSSWEMAVEWLKVNIQGRRHGDKQLYIYGGTNLGKSWFAMEVAKRVKTYWAPSGEEFFDGLDESVGLVVFDEWHCQQKVTFMNNFVDGTPMNIKVKGGQYHKTNNPMVIITSNMRAEDCYKNCEPLVREAWARRWTEVEVRERCNVRFL